MKVRSWTGLTGEIEVENELWHLVKVGLVALNHPPLINLVLRRRLPRDDRLRLSYLHEFGHFQTLPIALAHVPRAGVATHSTGTPSAVDASSTNRRSTLGKATTGNAART